MAAYKGMTKEQGEKEHNRRVRMFEIKNQMNGAKAQLEDDKLKYKVTMEVLLYEQAKIDGSFIEETTPEQGKIDGSFIEETTPEQGKVKEDTQETTPEQGKVKEDTQETTEDHVLTHAKERTLEEWAQEMKDNGTTYAVAIACMTDGGSLTDEMTYALRKAYYKQDPDTIQVIKGNFFAEENEGKVLTVEDYVTMVRQLTPGLTPEEIHRKLAAQGHNNKNMEEALYQVHRFTPPVFKVSDEPKSEEKKRKRAGNSGKGNPDASVPVKDPLAPFYKTFTQWEEEAKALKESGITNEDDALRILKGEGNTTSLMIEAVWKVYGHKAKVYSIGGVKVEDIPNAEQVLTDLKKGTPQNGNIETPAPLDMTKDENVEGYAAYTARIKHYHLEENMTKTEIEARIRQTPKMNANMLIALDRYFDLVDGVATEEARSVVSQPGASLVQPVFNEKMPLDLYHRAIDLRDEGKTQREATKIMRNGMPLTRPVQLAIRGAYNPDAAMLAAGWDGKKKVESTVEEKKVESTVEEKKVEAGDVDLDDSFEKRHQEKKAAYEDQDEDDDDDDDEVRF